MPARKSNRKPTAPDTKAHRPGSPKTKADPAEQRRIASVLDTLPVYLVLLTPDYHMSFANRFSRERFGEPSGRRCFEYLFGSTEPCEACQTYKVLQTMQPLEREWTGPDGRFYHVLDYPFKDNDGSTFILEMGIDITQQKLGEDGLRQALEERELRIKERTSELEERQKDLNRAQAVSRTGSWRMDVQHNVLLWSDETYRIFGIRPGTPMTYETFLASVHPSDREYVNTMWQAALEGKGYDIEHRIVVEDEVKWVRERAELEFDGQGTLRGGFGTVQDTTEKVQSEEAIKQAADQWQDTFDAIPDLISIHDRDFNIIKVNDAFAKAFGMTKEKLIGKKCYQVFHHMGSPIVGCPHQRTIKTGQSMREEIIEPTRNNTCFDISTMPVRNARHEIIASVHVARDITERKMAEAQLSFQARLLDTIEDAVVVTDAANLITYWGKGAMDALGWQPREVIGKDAFALLVPDGHKKQARDIEEALRSGRGWSGEFTAKRKDGTTLPFLLRSSPVTDSEGKFIGVITVGKDISELKEIDKMKDEFIGLISHELRTPLTIVSGSLRAAMSPGISAEDISEMLQNATEGADSLADILENMLELSRHQAGRLQLHIESVRMADVVQRVTERLKRLGVTQQFLVNIPADLPAVEADPLRAERIAHNLMENATKYSPPASQIRVSCHTEGNSVITEVTDQGRGISQADRSRLFELFQRVESPDGSAKGVGLGLVVCKRLAEAQGGWIKLESEVGRGSTFSFGLPVRRTK